MSVYDICPICGLSYLSHGARDTHVAECANKLKAEVTMLKRVIIDLTLKREWERWLMSDETETVMKELYPFSNLAMGE